MSVVESGNINPQTGLIMFSEEEEAVRCNK